MVDVLDTKRAATRFRILVEIADRQPAVSQGEVAEGVGVTSQAVSEYIRELIADGYVEQGGRSRYTVTKEGVDWLLQAAAEVRRFADHVTEDVLGSLQVDAAIAATDIAAGDEVGLGLREGLLVADPGEIGGATGRAANDARTGEVVGVTSFEGVMELDPGKVTVLQIPSVRTVDDPAENAARIAELAADVELVVCGGVEAVVATRSADIEPDTWFAPGEVAADAAGRGLDILVVASMDHVGRVTDALRDATVRYEVTETPEA